MEGLSRTGTRFELNWFKLKACVKCRGDLVWDDGDWLCLQCGRYYYTRLYHPGAIPEWQWNQASGPRKDKAAVLRPVLLHSYRAVQSEPVAPSPVSSRTPSTAVECRTVSMGLGSHSAAMQ